MFSNSGSDMSMTTFQINRFRKYQVTKHEFNSICKVKENFTWEKVIEKTIKSLGI